MKYKFKPSGLTYGESESSERRCAPEGATAGEIGEGRALPARLICKPGGLTYRKSEESEDSENYEESEREGSPMRIISLLPSRLCHRKCGLYRCRSEDWSL